jgi:hypothetical protein
VGSLDDLRAANRGGMDPSGIGSNRLASDVLWSDPTSTPGFQFNASRGIGMTFGPDVTEVRGRWGAGSLRACSGGPWESTRRGGTPQRLRAAGSWGW